MSLYFVLIYIYIDDLLMINKKNEFLFRGIYFLLLEYFLN